MLTLLSLVAMASAALLLIPSLVFFTEVLVGCFRPVSKIENTALRRDKPVAVLIPAHNEGTGIELTIKDVKQQLGPRDRLLVVADNCTDDTEVVAAALGGEVTVRNDPTRIGKGYALDWGIKHLAERPPEIVIVIDADCRLSPGTIDRLADACAQSQRPVQSLYLMAAPSGPTINHQVAEFAWRVKNWVRPLGLSALAQSCQLVGTGMAFPWHIIRSAELAGGYIVEDLKLGLELTTAGHPPLFCPGVVVTSTFPTSAEAAKTQRHRWEQGHVGLILTKAPAFFFAAFRHGNKELFALTLDLVVPPITLLALLLIATIVVAALATLASGSIYPLGISLVSALLTAMAIAMAWFKYGRDVLPPHSLALIGQYCLSKIYLYRAALFGRRISRWIRTDRS